jgi:DNA (cytosine-5)-methyltransferase 1
MIKLFEMFAGYGGASFSLKRAGIDFECVGVSEIEKDAMRCYTQNHKGYHYGDCTKINPNDLPDFDLLTGGFPCQSFSMAGKGKGEQDTRGTLFYEIIRIAEVKKPRWMLLENVKGLTTKNHKKTFETILSELDRIGYSVDYKVLNSKDYGTPQDRKRVFFVCFRDSEDWEKWKGFPEKEELKLFFNEILDNLPFREIPPFQFRNYGDKKRINGLKSVSDKCFHTLTTNRSHQNQYILNGNKTMCRLFEKQEVFRLMGFKDGEINLNKISHNQAHKLAGNGWDINLVSKIFQKMFNVIVPHTNFPSEFSENGKRHNISLKDNSNELSQISSNDETSLNNNIILNSKEITK